MPSSWTLILSFALLAGLSPCASSEPFSTGLVVGIGVASSALYAGWDKVRCQFKECCHEPWITNNLTKFEEDFNAHVFGQHMVLQVVTRALRSHLRKPTPSKALVLSFHGWTGGGKNYVAKFVAESLYKEGLRSKFVNLFLATLHFQNENLVDEYKLNLQDWIRGNVSECAQSLFIFDEMDKMPEGLIDAIKPFIDHHESIGGVDFRRSVFIFLSNTGGREITTKAYDYWTEGRTREELSYADFEGLIHRGAFNEGGGLHHSAVVEQSLVDHFVPFLPMERRHVKQCVQAESGQRSLTDREVERVVDQIAFWPKDAGVFSATGCKRVAQKVDILLEEMYDDL